MIPADALKSALLQPFTEFPAAFPEKERARLIEQARKIYAGAVAPKILNYGEPGTLQFGDIRIWPVNNYNHLVPDQGQCDSLTRTTHACGDCPSARNAM